MTGGDNFQGGMMGLGRGPELHRYEKHRIAGPRLIGSEFHLRPATLYTFLHESSHSCCECQYLCLPTRLEIPSVPIVPVPGSAGRMNGITFRYLCCID